MKKQMFFIIKVFFFLVLFTSFIITNLSIADIVPTDYASYGKSRDLKTKYILLNEEITKSIDSFDEKKNPTSKEKEEFKKIFKSLLVKCVELKEEINSGLSSVEKKKAETTENWQKASEEYYKNNPAPPSGSQESYFYHKSAPRIPHFDNYIDYIVEAKEEIKVDEERLKEYLRKLGVNNFSSQHKESKPLNNFLFLSFGVILMSILSFSILQFIRYKKNNS